MYVCTFASQEGITRKPCMCLHKCVYLFVCLFVRWFQLAYPNAMFATGSKESACWTRCPHIRACECHQSFSEFGHFASVPNAAFEYARQNEQIKFAFCLHRCRSLDEYLQAPGVSPLTSATLLFESPLTEFAWMVNNFDNHVYVQKP